MGSGPVSPCGLEDKVPPEPPGYLILEDLQTLHIPHKQETRGLEHNTGYFFLDPLLVGQTYLHTAVWELRR